MCLMTGFLAGMLKERICHLPLYMAMFLILPEIRKMQKGRSFGSCPLAFRNILWFLFIQYTI